MSLEISIDIFSHGKNVAGNFHRHFSSLETSPTFIGTVEMFGAENFHRHFLSQPKCRWKFPSTFFSVTAKMSLEISTDIFSHSQNVAGNFHRHFSSLETSPTFIGTVEMSGAGNFHRHFSLTAKMSLEISIDIFFCHSLNVAANFYRHFFFSQPKCR